MHAVVSRDVSPPTSRLLAPGPWAHEFIAANGARFHVALAGPQDSERPLVVLLHGFPQFWYAWRHQLPVLASAGHRVAAMDLRGFGASDKPPEGNNAPTSAADVAGVISSLGHSSAVVVGHGYGGAIAWSMPVIAPELTRGIAVLASPHPVALRAKGGPQLSPRARAEVLALHAPWLAEQGLQRRGLTAHLLKTWGASPWPPDAIELYTGALRSPTVSRRALEHMRWQMRSSRRPAGRRWLAALRTPIKVPVLSIHGTRDRFVAPGTMAEQGEHVRGLHRFERIADVGHYLPEEAPAEVSSRLLRFLDELSPRA